MHFSRGSVIQDKLFLGHTEIWLQALDGTVRGVHGAQAALAA